MVKPPLRTKSIGFKVSEEEYAQLETAAQAGGCTLGEWCRETLLASVNGQEAKSADVSTASGGTGQQALMAELVALRAIPQTTLTLPSITGRMPSHKLLTRPVFSRSTIHAQSQDSTLSREP
jgi:hypothetical protein